MSRRKCLYCGDTTRPLHEYGGGRWCCDSCDPVIPRYVERPALLVDATAKAEAPPVEELTVGEKFALTMKFLAVVAKDREVMQGIAARSGLRYLESPILISDFQMGYEAATNADDDTVAMASTKVKGRIPTSYSRGFSKGLRDRKNGVWVTLGHRLVGAYNETVRELRKKYPEEYPERDETTYNDPSH